MRSILNSASEIGAPRPYEISRLTDFVADGSRRAVFNKALELQNDRKAKSEKPISYLEMAHLLMEWKQIEEMAFLKEAPSQALQQTLMDLDRAIKDTFRKKGDPAKKRWPRFKAKDIGDGFRR